MFGKIKYQMKRIISKKNGYVVMVGIISLFLVIGGFSFAIFTSTTERKGSLNIVTGDLTVVIESESLDSNHSLKIKSGESIEIEVILKNMNKVDAKFNFYYEAKDGVNVSYDSTKDEPPKKNGIILKDGESRVYRLKIFNDTESNQTITFGSDTGLYNKELEFPEGKKTIEKVMDNITVVKDNNMIEVVYDETSKNWEKASENNWYDYDIGKWANAVTVTSASRSKYQSADEGTVIPMTDIETMWVYIPRYSYTIGSEDGTNYYGKKGEYLSVSPTQNLPGEIDIKFIGKNEKDTGSAQYKVANGVSGWRTPDGFTFGTEELSGIWIAKFDTSSSNPSATNGGDNVTSLDAMIKPNVTAWRSIQMANMEIVAKNMSKSGNRYGFSTTKLNSHVMKNSEWALVAYLSQSKYGKLGNRQFSGANKEIYPNSSDDFICGCSLGRPAEDNAEISCNYRYDEPLNGTGASTTGTIYGIYDMSGGSWECVMGDYAPNGQRYSGVDTSNHSNYTGLLKNGSSVTGKSWLEDKYYDFYTSDNFQTACSGSPCITHALNETVGWYGDDNKMLKSTAPWLSRGGARDQGSKIGIFSYSYSLAYNNLNYSYHLVLTAG